MRLPSKAVFTAAEAQQLGVTAFELRSLLRRGHLVQLRRKTYCTAETFAAAKRIDRGELVMSVLAAQACVSSPTWATGLTVARLRRLPMPLDAPETIELVAQTETTSPRRYRDLTVQVARVPESHRTATLKIPCVTLPRAIVDIARDDGLAAALIVGDRALRREQVSRQELDGALELCSGMPGMKAARDAVAHMDGVRETPLESESFAFFIEEGIPLPQCQVWIGSDRVDFLWREARLIGEADGRIKYDGYSGDAEDDALWREKVRTERLEEDGSYDVVRWTYPTLRRRRAQLAKRIRRYL